MIGVKSESDITSEPSGRRLIGDIRSWPKSRVRHRTGAVRELGIGLTDVSIDCWPLEGQLAGVTRDVDP